MANLRVGVLLVVFFVLLGALAYDFRVARPAAQAGYEKVIGLLEKRAKSRKGDAEFEPADVQRELGCAPSSTRQQGLTTIETYSWRGGMPLRTYNLYVLYQGVSNPKLANALQSEPTDKEIASVEIPATAQPMTAGPVLHTPGQPTGGTPPAQPPKEPDNDHSSPVEGNASTDNDRLPK